MSGSDYDIIIFFFSSLSYWSIMKDKFLFSAIMVMLISAWGITLFSGESTFSRLCKEDGLFEWLTSIFFLISSFFLFAAIIKRARQYDSVHEKITKSIFFLLLAAMAFFAFGEEINWGQRILGLEMPALFEQTRANEISVHNLDFFKDNVDKRGIYRFLTLNGAGLLFYFIWFVFLPIFNHLSRRFSTRLKKINLPIVPLWLSLLFLINFAILKGLQFYLYNPTPKSFTEMREYIYSAFFLAASLYFFLYAKQKVDHD